MIFSVVAPATGLFALYETLHMAVPMAFASRVVEMALEHYGGSSSTAKSSLSLLIYAALIFLTICFVIPFLLQVLWSVPRYLVMVFWYLLKRAVAGLFGLVCLPFQWVLGGKQPELKRSTAEMDRTTRSDRNSKRKRLEGAVKTRTNPKPRSKSPHATSRTATKSSVSSAVGKAAAARKEGSKLSPAEQEAWIRRCMKIRMLSRAEATAYFERKMGARATTTAYPSSMSAVDDDGKDIKIVVTKRNAPTRARTREEQELYIKRCMKVRNVSRRVATDILAKRTAMERARGYY